MTHEQATQVAALLNTRNELQGEYTAERILQDTNNYLAELRDGVVVGCVEIKKVQWYQWELRHLSVAEQYEGKGLGKWLIRLAEEKARQGGATIVQCTIRVGNEASEQAFRRSGYREACCFYNAKTDRYVGVWQKVLNHRAEPPAEADRPRQ
jgi:GNAT superfamily N-acetyltransferase